MAPKIVSNFILITLGFMWRILCRLALHVCYKIPEQDQLYIGNSLILAHNSGEEWYGTRKASMQQPLVMSVLLEEPYDAPRHYMAAEMTYIYF